MIWLAAVLGSLVGMAAGGIAGEAMCINCEFEAILWGLAGSVVGGIATGVAAGLVARRFGHRRSGPVSWVILLLIASWQLVVGFSLFVGVGFWLDFISPVMVVAGGVVLMVVTILQATEAFHRSG